MGAAGALEAFACIMAIQTGCVPPTINLHNPGEGLDLDYVPNEARAMDVRIAMSNSFGFGGHNASIVLGRYDG
jgi:3-oxoacyl-[acyl-carrier-protein] synthase II